MAKLWKYPLLYVLVAALTVTIFLALRHYVAFTLTIQLPEWLRPVVLLPVALAFVSTNLPDILPKKVLARLRWLHSRPGMNQFYYFIAFQVVVLFVAAVLTHAFPESYLAYLADLTASILGALTVAVYGGLMLRVLKNS
jgi:hypothetical protein